MRYPSNVFACPLSANHVWIPTGQGLVRWSSTGTTGASSTQPQDAPIEKEFKCVCGAVIWGY